MVGLWLVVRAALLFFSALWLGEPMVTLPFTTALGVVGVVGGITMVDVKRHHEWFILASLGVPTSTLLALACAPPILFELLIVAAPLP